MSITDEQIPGGLPPGRVVIPGGGAEPVLWVTDEPLDAADAGGRWADLFARRAETGLWPLLLGAMAHQDGDARPRPWHSGEIVPLPERPAGHVDVSEELASAWKYELDWIAEEEVPADEVPAPFDRAWPGLAPDSEPGVDPDDQAIALATSPADVPRLLDGIDAGPYLGLIAAGDGAAAIDACGWTSESGCTDVPTVLRSWQQRFGVRVCSLGRDTLALTVAWPPRTEDHARQIAMEHYAFCPDLTQVHEDFDAYVTGLVGATVWSMWWD